MPLSMNLADSLNSLVGFDPSRPACCVSSRPLLGGAGEQLLNELLGNLLVAEMGHDAEDALLKSAENRFLVLVFSDH